MIGKTNARTTGSEIGGVVAAYTVLSGETVSAGDFVQFVSELESATALSTSTVNGSCAVALDSTRVLVATYNSAAVVTISGGTISIGAFASTGLTISSNDCSPRAVLLGTDKVLLIGVSGSATALRGVVLTVSGTTVTAGTATALATITSGVDRYAVCKLSNTEAFLAYTYGSSSYLYGMVLTISGTTISAGTGTRLISNTYRGVTLDVAALASDTVLVLHSTSITSNSPTSARLGAVVATISGGTITAGTSVVLNSTSGSGYSPRVVGISATRAFAVAGTTSTTQTGYDLTISGTQVTVRESFNIASGLQPGTTTSYPGNNLQCAHMGSGVVAGVYRASGTYAPILSKAELGINDADDGAQQDATQSGISLLRYITVVPIDGSTAFVLNSESSSLYGYLLNLRAKVQPMPSTILSSTLIGGVAKTAGSGGGTADIYTPS